MKTVSMIKTRIRQHDIVQVIAGRGAGARHAKDGGGDARGVRGKVLEIDRERGRALVQGAKIVYKHQRVNRNDPNAPKVGRVEKEASIQLSNLMVVCPSCDKATRIGIRTEEVERADGTKKIRRIRVCKACGADIPERS